MTASGPAQILAMIFASLGMLFMAVSLIGMIRFPDFYTRLHAQGIGDTLGALLVIIAMMIAAGLRLISIKLLMIFAVIMLTNPMGTSLMIRAAMHRTDYQHYRKQSPPANGRDTQE